MIQHPPSFRSEKVVDHVTDAPLARQASSCTPVRTRFSRAPLHDREHYCKKQPFSPVTKHSPSAAQHLRRWYNGQHSCLPSS